MFPIDIRDPGSSAVIDLCRFFGPGLIGYEDPASVSVERSTWEQDVLHRYTRTLRFLDLDPSARSF